MKFGLIYEICRPEPFDDCSLVGTPDKVAQGVQDYVDIGADQLICLVQAGRIPHERIMESLRLFGREVLPRFR